MKAKKRFLQTAGALAATTALLFTGCAPAPPQPVDKNELLYPVTHMESGFTQEDMIYFIMTDRFYDGNADNNIGVNVNTPKGYHGGDIKGVTEKLDYIKSLGATTIWLTPIVENDFGGYHGYWARDFYKVDSHWGTMEELKELVDEAHKRDIKIMLDYVVNHTGQNSPWVKDEEKADWFHERVDIRDWNNQDQVEDGWLLGLPDLNTENQEVRDYFVDNAIWWIEETGIDGMRLDTVKHVPKSYWNEFSTKIREKYPNFFLLGEVWHNDPNYLNSYYDIGFDSLTNYALFDGVRQTFKRHGTTAPLLNAIAAQEGFTRPDLMATFIDNHDNSRFMNNAQDNKEAYLNQGLTYLLTTPGIPVIYYGTEIAMRGGGDPYNRKLMEWDRVEGDPTLAFYQNLIALRQGEEAIKTGDMNVLASTKHVIAYERTTGDDQIIVIMNVLPAEAEIDLTLPAGTYDVLLAANLDQGAIDPDQNDLGLTSTLTFNGESTPFTMDALGIRVLKRNAE